MEDPTLQPEYDKYSKLDRPVKEVSYLDRSNCTIHCNDAVDCACCEMVTRWVYADTGETVEDTSDEPPF